MEIEKKEGEQEEKKVEEKQEEKQEETREELLARLAKSEEEKENYKKGLLEREEKLKQFKTNSEKTLEKEEEKQEKKEEDETDWDEASKKFQEETVSKSAKLAEETVNKAIEKKNEKQAIADFLEGNPTITDEQWQKIIANYNPKNGKDSVKGIIKDLERAHVLYKFDAGEKIDPAEIRKNDAEKNLKDLSTTTGQGNSGRHEENKKEVSDGQLSIASRMRVSEEALAKEDDSLTAEIKIV